MSWNPGDTIVSGSELPRRSAKVSNDPSDSPGRRLSVRLTSKAKRCLDSKCELKGMSPSELVNAMLEELGGETEDEPSIDLHSGKIHISKWTPRNCPECAVPNPDFQDEVKCRDCGIALGSEEEAKKLKACPNCPLTFDKDGLPEHRHYDRVKI